MTTAGRGSRRATSLVTLFLSVLGVLGSLVPTAQAHDGTVLTGFGSASIDGVVGPSDEWGLAGCIAFPVNVPEGGTTSGRACAMNDESTLYLLVQFDRPTVDAGNSAAFEFDNDHAGGPRVNGDDVLLINPSIGFLDEVRTNAAPCSPGAAPAACGFVDSSIGGSLDGSGAFFNDGVTTVYEFAHPLNSDDDAHDFGLRPGDTVGFTVFIRLLGAGGPIADTAFPTVCSSCPDLFGDIVIAGPVIPVLIDIKPAAPRNRINPRSHALIRVAVLSTEEFDATTVDPASVRFGPRGLVEDSGKTRFEDVDGDGRDDLLLHFRIDETGIRCGDTSAGLTGRTFTGQAIHGLDSIRTVGCR
jgi:hypothetical protein